MVKLYFFKQQSQKLKKPDEIIGRNVSNNKFIKKTIINNQVWKYLNKPKLTEVGFSECACIFLCCETLKN